MKNLAITNKVGHFLITNTVWIFITTIVFVSFFRIMILLDTETRESLVYLPLEKWLLYIQFAGSILVVFLPILLFSYFRNALKKIFSKMDF